VIPPADDRIARLEMAGRVRWRKTPLPLSMPRIVRHEQSAPIKIDPNAKPGEPNAWPRDEQGNLKPVFVCACGLSDRFPFCDGTHKTTCKAEQPGVVYTYDKATKAVVDQRPE
jgi:CDGSH-type Zn-finger protein